MLINLLPGRAVKRAKLRKRNTWICVNTGLLSIAMILIAAMRIESVTQQQLQRNTYLQNIIAQRQMQADKVKRLRELIRLGRARLMQISGLQQHARFSLWILEAIGKIIPDNIYLVRIKKQQNKVSLLGRATSYRDIRTLTHNMAQHQELEQAKLVILNNTSRNNIAFKFILDLVLKTKYRGIHYAGYIINS